MWIWVSQFPLDPFLLTHSYILPCESVFPLDSLFAVTHILLITITPAMSFSDRSEGSEGWRVGKVHSMTGNWWRGFEAGCPSCHQPVLVIHWNSASRTLFFNHQQTPAGRNAIPFTSALRSHYPIIVISTVVVISAAAAAAAAAAEYQPAFSVQTLLRGYYTTWTIKKCHFVFLIITLSRFLYFFYQWKLEGILYKEVNKIYHFTLTVSPHYLVKLKWRISSTF